MMTYDNFWRRLAVHYGPDEAKAMARWVLEARFGLSLADVLCGKDKQLSADDQTLLEEIAQRLERAEPVQYVLGWADFCGRRFCVEPGVLIPRPETEELCRWIVADCADSRPRLLDVGTGSGCIAATLALELPGSRVTAWDVSPDALRQAAANARRLGAGVDFERRDALTTIGAADADRWDLIVSNPPYVCEREAADMDANVLDYEPRLALFVPDDDPLRFYRAIADYALAALRRGGSLYFEINPLYAADVDQSLSDRGFCRIEARADMAGKTRFYKAVRP